jgi:hypothetical protein
VVLVAQCEFVGELVQVCFEVLGEGVGVGGVGGVVVDEVTVVLGEGGGVG